MYQFRILYLEHDLERICSKSIIEQSGDVVVDMLARVDEAELSGLLSKNRYELVITDANFLEEDQDHETFGVGNYELERIIKLVREKDTRTRIAVLTSFSPTLLAEHESDLENVDYIWDKGTIPDEFLRWQIKAIIRDVNREYPEHTLLNKLYLLLKDKYSLHPWYNQLDSIITKYRSRKNEKDKFDAISNSIAEIFAVYKLRTVFDPLMKSLIEMESLNVAGKPTTWGHLRHSINVYWLGSYILNSGIVDKQKIVRMYELNDETDIEFIWLITTLFHDIGYLGEIGDDIVKRCNALASNYPSNMIKFNEPIKVIPTTDMDDILPRLGHVASASLSPLYNEINSSAYAFDHCVISALTVYKKFINNSPSDSLINISCSAIAAHSFTRPKYNLKYNAKFCFAEAPFITLLILCDIVQAWERDTGKESARSRLPIQTVELSKIDVNVEERVISLCINYLPFKYISPEEHKMVEIQQLLTEDIFQWVIPALDTLVFNSSTDFTINVTFMLDNRFNLSKWSSK
jgi:hypothetical protein